MEDPSTIGLTLPFSTLLVHIEDSALSSVFYERGSRADIPEGLRLRAGVRCVLAQYYLSTSSVLAQH